MKRRCAIRHYQQLSFIACQVASSLPRTATFTTPQMPLGFTAWYFERKRKKHFWLSQQRQVLEKVARVYAIRAADIIIHTAY